MCDEKKVSATFLNLYTENKIFLSAQKHRSISVKNECGTYVSELDDVMCVIKRFSDGNYHEVVVMWRDMV